MRIEVPVGWKKVRYQDAASINAKSLKGSTASDTAIDYLDISSVPSPGVLGEAQEMLFGESPSRARRVVRSGDTLVSTVRPYLRAFAFVPSAAENLIASTGFAVLTANSGVDPVFLFQTVFLDDFLSFLEERMTGSSYPAVNASDVAKAPLLLPPLPEQKKIAAILSSVDEAIQATQAVIEQTRRVKEGLLQDLLTRGIGHTRFKQTEIGEIPEGWEVLRLEDIVESPNGLQTGPFGSQLHASDYSDQGIPVIMPKDIVAGRISADTIARIPETLASSKVLSKHRLLAGDIVFGRRGDIGRCGLSSENHEGWLCGTGCLRARPSKQVIPEFLIHRLHYSDSVQWLNENAVGQTMLNLNTTILGALPLALPPKGEQRKIAQIFDQIEESLVSESETLAELGEVKAGLLQDLLTGKVRVSV